MVFLISLRSHGFAHGWVAYQFGDTTAKEQGRVTLLPYKHLDYIGSLIVPIILFVSGSVVFGFAKPVPVDFDKLNAVGKILTGSAGIVSNLLLALFGLGMFFVTNHYMQPDASMVIQVVCVGVFSFFPINCFLFVFNLLPIPPLDGWIVASNLISKNINSIFIKRPWLMILTLFIGIFIMKCLSPYLLFLIRYVTQLGLR